MFKRSVKWRVLQCLLFFSVMCIWVPGHLLSEELRDKLDKSSAPQLTLTLPTTTQGPLWPPSAISDKNGNFILVGSAPLKDETGRITLVVGQYLIISKDTVPPLDSRGKEDFTDPLGAAYEVVRSLDLTEGSPDLDLVLYSNSYGPPEGDFGGGPRVPSLLVSAYNLNSFPLTGQPCPDIFPSDSQRFNYLRPSFPLHKVPVSGYQGDQVSYDANTGQAFVPSKRTGFDCPQQGCNGENQVDARRQSPITLGEWLKARVSVHITLTDYDNNLRAYTAARFTIQAHNLLPNSIYHVFALRANLLAPRPIPSVADPLGMPSVIITDAHGRGYLSVSEKNPFPATGDDNAGLRIVGLSVSFRSSFQNDGACVTRYGPGVDVHAVASSFADGTFDFTNLVTR